MSDHEQWKSIETAPQDLPLLTWRSGSKPTVAWLDKRSDIWFQAVDGSNHDHPLYARPTHWQYLPPSPDEQTEPPAVPVGPISGFGATITAKFDESEAREVHAKLAEILSKPQPIPPSTEEPTVDSAGWIELKVDPGTLYSAEYYAKNERYYYGDYGKSNHNEVARLWMIPKPKIDGGSDV